MLSPVKYTHRHIQDGNIGIGTLPILHNPILEEIANEYMSFVPDKSATTHHTYYTDLTGSLKSHFDKIQSSPFWDGLKYGAFSETDSVAVIMYVLNEMNEIYYSNPKPNFKKTNLYGAAANLIPHRDCILFYFPGIRVYRVIVCTTDGNTDIITEFITHKSEKCLNKGDYMVFDFDRTIHQVKKVSNVQTPRILLKLHYLVLDKRYSEMLFLHYYIRFASNCYIVYYRIARYTEQIGTDPTTFPGFFFGIIWEYPFYPVVRYSAIAVYLSMVVAWINTDRPVVNASLSMVSIYICIVFWFWISHIIYSAKEDKY